MFGSLGWAEILVIVIAALIIFGPEKLPSAARDAGKALRQVRDMAQGARTQLKTELGPEFSNLDLATLNPRGFVRRHLLGDDNRSNSTTILAEQKALLAELEDVGRPMPNWQTSRPLARGELPPVDPDAT